MIGHIKAKEVFSEGRPGERPLSNTTNKTPVKTCNKQAIVEIPTHLAYEQVFFALKLNLYNLASYKINTGAFNYRV